VNCYALFGAVMSDRCLESNNTKGSEKKIFTVFFSVQLHSHSLCRKTDLEDFLIRKKIIEMY